MSIILLSVLLAIVILKTTQVLAQQGQPLKVVTVGSVNDYGLLALTFPIAAGGQVKAVTTTQKVDKPNQPSEATLSPFGIGGVSQMGRNMTRWIPQMAAIGIRMMRSCNPQPDGLSDQTPHPIRRTALWSSTWRQD